MSRYLAIFRDAQHDTSARAVSAVSAVSPAVPPAVAPNGANDTNGNGVSDHFGRLADAPGPGPVGDDAEAWHDWWGAAVAARMSAVRIDAHGRAAPILRSRPDAERRTYGEALNVWHARHGAPAEPDRCAGCREPLPANWSVTLTDGARIHDDPGRYLDCLTHYGQRWHANAAAGLAALGIPIPKGEASA